MSQARRLIVIQIMLLICITSSIFAESAEPAEPVDAVAEAAEAAESAPAIVETPDPAVPAVITEEGAPATEVVEPTPAAVETPEPVAPPTPVVPIIPVEIPAPVVAADSAVTDTAATARPKIAVYVTGSKDEVENKALGTYILDALVRTDRYTAIERSEVFLAEIDNEQVKQRSGAIDDEQISRLGKQSGVQFVCVADITKAFMGNQVSVRILDVETAEVVAVGVSEGPLKNMNDLRKISESVVNAMLGIEVVREKRVRFGARAAYNNAYVAGYGFDVVVLNESDFSFDEVRVDGEFGGGSGFEFGVVALVRITKMLSVESGANFVIRKPAVVPGVAEVSEFAVAVPALLRYKIGTSPVYVQGGAQFDIPFGAKLQRSGESAADFGERSGFEAGLVVGAGYQVIKNLSADIRLIGNVTSFDGQKGHSLLQVVVGCGWMF